MGHVPEMLGWQALAYKKIVDQMKKEAKEMIEQNSRNYMYFVEITDFNFFFQEYQIKNRSFMLIFICIIIKIDFIKIIFNDRKT